NAVLVGGAHHGLHFFDGPGRDGGGSPAVFVLAPRGRIGIAIGAERLVLGIQPVGAHHVGELLQGGGKGLRHHVGRRAHALHEVAGRLARRCADRCGGADGRSRGGGVRGGQGGAPAQRRQGRHAAGGRQ